MLNLYFSLKTVFLFHNVFLPKGIFSHQTTSVFFSFDLGGYQNESQFGLNTAKYFSIDFTGLKTMFCTVHNRLSWLSSVSVESPWWFLVEWSFKVTYLFGPEPWNLIVFKFWRSLGFSRTHSYLLQFYHHCLKHKICLNASLSTMFTSLILRKWRWNLSYTFWTKRLPFSFLQMHKMF